MITEKIFELQNKGFREFNSKLIPNIDKSKIIGVKTPDLKRLAKELIKSGKAYEFLTVLPHTYFEENQLHAFIISETRDFDKTVKQLEEFLPYVDNWATCDQLIPKAIAKNPELILDRVYKWLGSNSTYTVRLAIGFLMRYFLDSNFKSVYLQAVANVKSEDYYVKMMQAWYFATALAKQYEETLPFITENRLDTWVHNKTIQKARESLRISNEHKKYLKNLTIKSKGL